MSEKLKQIFNLILWFLEGIIVGFGAIMPGLSGGTLCVAFGIYLPLIGLISSPKKNISKYGKMLICFGLSWPISVVKAYKARTTKGQSLPFILLIITGYIAGISAKIINNQFNYVLIVYIINLAIVLFNVVVYIRNYRLDKINNIK